MDQKNNHLDTDDILGVHPVTKRPPFNVLERWNVDNDGWGLHGAPEVDSYDKEDVPIRMSYEQLEKQRCNRLRKMVLKEEFPNPGSGWIELTTVDITYLVNYAIDKGLCKPKSLSPIHSINKSDYTIDPGYDVITSLKRERTFMASVKELLKVHENENKEKEESFMKEGYDKIRDKNIMMEQRAAKKLGIKKG